jgi:radical SAM protein with 4Fe4S-binding SPASM domain
MFCSVAGDLANNNSMSLNIAKKIIDECAHNGVIQVNYSGGEPFLYDWDDLSELLKYGNKNKINQTIATNGTLLDLYMIRWIKPYIKSINISLHGDREHHNYITKNDCYDDVIRTIRNCYEEKVRVNLLYTLSKENLQKKNILSVIDIANKYKCGIFFARTNDIGNSHINNITTTIKDIQELIDMSKKNDIENKIKFANCIPNCVLPVGLKEYRKSCGAGVTFASISSNGDVKICSVSKKVLGRYTSKTTLEDIWNSEELKKYRSLEWMNSTCRSCKDFRNCKGGCKVEGNEEYNPDILFKNRVYNLWNEIAEKTYKLKLIWLKKANGKILLATPSLVLYVDRKAERIIEDLLHYRNLKKIINQIDEEEKFEYITMIVDFYNKGIITI